MLCCRCGVLLVLCICPPLACLLTASSSPCPPGCCCPPLPGLLVLCESLGLRSLPPRFVPLATSALSVARNRLCDVDHLLRPFSGLQELSLSHNLLARFPRGLPPSLESLLLQENRITYITSGALRHLGNLTRLDLEDNRIRAVQPGALWGLTRLRVLTLKGNRLISLPLDLPSSLTHLDISENCISVLDLASLSALVNLQVLKINSNCLRSVPESAFDRLPRLRTVDLGDNLWLCKCNLLYLYRWLINGRLRMATDLVCVEPVHLARRLLLNLSVVTLCPGVLTPDQKTHQPDSISALGTDLLENRTYLANMSEQMSQEPTSGLLPRDAPETRVFLDHFSLETLTYEECMSLNSTQSVSPPTLLLNTTTSLPDEEQKCTNITARDPRTNRTTSAVGETRPLLSTSEEAWPTPEPRPLTDSTVVICLLAALCVLVALLLLIVLFVLKRVLLNQQRVAPLDVGSGG